MSNLTTTEERETGWNFDEDEETGIQVAETATAAITRSEIDAQLTAAHKFPRSVTKFMNSSHKLATFNRAVAESCIYSLPRGGKMIAGPSVRLAEIVASCYGNLHYGSRIVDTDDTNITAQGVAWDLEKNLRVTVEIKRRITDKYGKRFNEDMIIMTGNAAASIALRNAIFRVVPRAYVDQIYREAQKLAVGDAKSFSSRRDEFMARIAKAGVSQERVLARLNKQGVNDIEPEDLELLMGLGNAIREGSMQLDEAFPDTNAPAAPAAGAPDGRRMSMKRGRVTEAQTEPVERQPGED